MKYRILIDQQAYDQHEEFDSLDVVDIGIMECIADFVYNNRSELINIDGTKYYWVSHTSIIKDFPRSGIKSKAGIRKRIKKLESVGLIKLYEGNQMVSRSYYRITDKFNLTRRGMSRNERLQNDTPCPQNIGGCTAGASPLSSKGQAPCPQKGNDYINNNTSNTNTIRERENLAKAKPPTKEGKILACKKREEKFITSVNNFSQYSSELLGEFINYWTELNKSETKMKFELQRTFEIKKRLITWSNNQKKFENKGGAKSKGKLDVYRNDPEFENYDMSKMNESIL